MAHPWLRQRQTTAFPQHGCYRHGNTHLIELRHVVKNYINAAGIFPALRDVSLFADQGEFVAVLGKSGSGKSTLMNMIAGIDRPTSGEVLVGDTAVHTLTEEQMTVWRGLHVGVVFQFFQLLPTLTVVENVMLPMDVCNACPAREFHPRAIQLLTQVGMAPHANKLPTVISGGEQQRVAIARALANNPDIILADEPTGSLDSMTAEVVLKIFEHLVTQGTTILMVTHDNELAHRAGRIIMLADGQVVDSLTSEADNDAHAGQSLVLETTHA